MPDGMTKTPPAPATAQGWLGRDLDRDALYWDFTPSHLAAIDELMARIEKTGPEVSRDPARAFLAPGAGRRSRSRAGADQDRAGPPDHARLSGR